MKNVFKLALLCAIAFILFGCDDIVNDVSSNEGETNNNEKLYITEIIAPSHANWGSEILITVKLSKTVNTGTVITFDASGATAEEASVPNGQNYVKTNITMLNSGNATLKAVCGDSSKTVNIIGTDSSSPVVVKELNPTTISMAPNSTATITVTLNKATSITEPQEISIASDEVFVIVPASIAIAGEQTGTFQIQTTDGASAGATETVTAQAGSTEAKKLVVTIE